MSQCIILWRNTQRSPVGPVGYISNDDAFLEAANEGVLGHNAVITFFRG